jgi:hypothetical protein
MKATMAGIKALKAILSGAAGWGLLTSITQ